jgi:hypothetical protein
MAYQDIRTGSSAYGGGLSGNLLKDLQFLTERRPNGGSETEDVATATSLGVQ